MRKSVTLLALVFILALAVSCGGGASQEAAPASSQPAKAPEAAAKTVDPATAGVIRGTVHYDGKAPKASRIRMNADPTCAAQHKKPVYARNLQVSDAGMVQYAFVWIKSGLEGYHFEAPTAPRTLDQKGCMYHPHMLGLQTGQPLQIINSDPTTHNINPSPKNNRNWNISQGPKATPQTKRFARQEVMIPVKCNVHPWMKSYIGVVGHPYFAITGTDGSFELPNVPPGDYTVQVWHESLGTREFQVSVGESETKTLEVNYEAR